MLRKRELELLSEEKISLSKTRLLLAKERIAYADEIMKLGDYKTVANRFILRSILCNAGSVGFRRIWF